MPVIKETVGTALRDRTTREAIEAYEKMWHAITTLDNLPAGALEALRDHLAFDVEGKEGSHLGDYLKAYAAYVNCVAREKRWQLNKGM